MISDYHIHTFLCKHAEGDVSEYVNTARERQLSEMCFTDHAPDPGGYDFKHRMEINQFPVYTGLVSKLSEGSFEHDNNAPVILFGVEADYYGGCERFLGKWLPEQKFDLVIGSIHYIKDWGFDNPQERSVWDSVDVTNTWREYFELVGILVGTKMFDVIGHLDLPKKFGYRPSDRDLKEMVQPVLDRIADAGMGIEINTSGLHKPIKEIYPSPMLLELACEREIPICFGSDAHAPQDVGYAFDLALKLAREAGYTRCLRFRRREKELVPMPSDTN